MPIPMRLITASFALASTQSPIASFLLPCLVQPLQQRHASILASLSDNRAAYNKKIRRGRGPASGKGKTSGRGHKGQKQHGKVPAGFNGGQTPDIVVSGVRGFENQFSLEMSPLNVDRVQAWIDQGRIDPSKPITLKELNESRCLHGIKDGVKLLARGAEQLRTPINIVVSQASSAAIAAVEKAGGTITTRYYAPTAIPRILKGEMDPIVSLLHDPEKITDELRERASKFRYRLPDCTSRKDFEYYRDAAHRGYLSHMVGEGEGPSLFFKPPRDVKDRPRMARKGSVGPGRMESKLW